MMISDDQSHPDAGSESQEVAEGFYRRLPSTPAWAEIWFVWQELTLKVGIW